MRHKRTKIWIDRFQTYLSLRIGIYFLFYQAAVWVLVIFMRHIVDGLESLLGPAIAFYGIVFSALTVLTLGFLVVYDAMRFTHRVSGPLYRFRKVIKAVADGDEVELVHLRKGDFLQELKEEFNAMLISLEQRGAVALKSAAVRPAEQALSR